MTTVEHITRDELLTHLQSINRSIDGLADVQRQNIVQQAEQATRIAVLYERVDNMRDYRARIASALALLASAGAAIIAFFRGAQ